MSADMQPIELIVSHRGVQHRLSLLPNDTIALLQARLEELTSVPPYLQKLLFKGKKANIQETDTLSLAGFKNGTKVQMLGSTTEELGRTLSADTEHQRKERILRERALKAPVKVRSTSSPSTSSQYTFNRIEPLAHLPEPASARALLTRLANDPAIRHVMQRHHLAVDLLTELAPHEQPHLLGLNVNAGQAIKLRLRTDRYDGFRLYSEVRKVLCHELTHNVWQDHDNNFKEMNSQLNREVAEFERAATEGTHHLVGSGDAYQPSSELEAEAQTYILGGTPILPGDESREERRRRLLEATMKRLQKEEEELEERCGTTAS
ncbi:WLM domain-containing protein [Fomitopsis serialis]|uniref:WLM domain-containing protein n=1 Tax=Fomitopsis serialis TaxID=139415 RepID=UPI002007FA53|nr:WLM domain-containing protein [Neoantrodia serialis]KAH9930209.1 WLM domain-containing protein [Neoantrodia serialis]